MRRVLPVLVTGAVIFAVLVFGVGQLVLPRLAASRVRSELGGTAHGVSVSVSAFPAIELLWHHADRVTIHLRSYTAGASGVGAALGRTGDVGHLRVSADTAHLGLITVHDAQLIGNAGRLTGSATIDEADLRAAIPFLQSVTPVASARGALTLRGTADVFGLSAAVDARVSLRAGAIVVTPDLPLGDLARITVFFDRHLTVRSLSATHTAGGFRLAVTAQVH